MPPKTKSAKKVSKYVGSGSFKKGKDPRRNLGGRPKGSKNKFSVADLRHSIENVEKKKQQTFMEAWIESAWGDPQSMSAIMQFMLPKLKSIEGMVGSFEATMEDELAIAIQNKLKRRLSRE